MTQERKKADAESNQRRCKEISSRADDLSDRLRREGWRWGGEDLFKVSQRTTGVKSVWQGAGVRAFLPLACPPNPTENEIFYRRSHSSG